jgi:hypothetical protein
MGRGGETGGTVWRQPRASGAAPGLLRFETACGSLFENLTLGQAEGHSVRATAIQRLHTARFFKEPGKTLTSSIHSLAWPPQGGGSSTHGRNRGPQPFFMDLLWGPRPTLAYFLQLLTVLCNHRKRPKGLPEGSWDTGQKMLGISL